jgi:hypothetical protein
VLSPARSGENILEEIPQFHDIGRLGKGTFLAMPWYYLWYHLYGEFMPYILALFLFLSFPGCNDASIILPPAPNSYQYQAFDSVGVLAISGWLTIDIRDSAHVTGSWHFAKTTSRQNTGPQTGNGTLAGFFDHHILNINLNPGFVDNNVFLRGQFSPIEYGGNWSWIGFPGVMNHGTFYARRN